MGKIVTNDLWSSYFYEGTNVLKNNYDEKDFDKLKKIEVNISFEKLMELRENNVDYSFSKEYLKQLHRYIFESVYPFAGEYRVVNMMKLRGNFLFAKTTDDFDNYLDNLFEEVNRSLSACNSLAHFSSVLASLYSKLIYCHPFREGNGRCIREFVREFSIYKSKELGIPVELDWQLIDRSELDRNIEISHLYPGLTNSLFLKALVPVEEKRIVK